jgi:hypothetical protein
VSVGHAGDTNRFIEIEGYRALEGVQILIGTKNVVNFMFSVIKLEISQKNIVNFTFNSR